MCNITERYIEKGMRIGFEEGYKIGFEEGFRKGLKMGFEEGFRKGMKMGLEGKSIVKIINIYRTDSDLGEQEIKGRIMDRFGLDSMEAERYMSMEE